MSKPKTYGFFRKSDVHDIKNPAYIVENKSKHIVDSNEEFTKLTHFTPSDTVPPKECYQLFEGVWETEKKELWQICSAYCAIRTLEPGRAGVIRNLWINSKDYRGQPVKRKEDVYIFLFKENQEMFTLHILSDRGVVHSDSYFKYLYRPGPVNVKTDSEVLKYVVKDVKPDDVYRIQNPAYAVKELKSEEVADLKRKIEELKTTSINFKNEMTAEAGSGCVVAWNKEFEVLTNFTPEDIDWNPCEKLIGGIREVGCEDICKINCPIRNQQSLVVPVIRDFFIRSRDKSSGNIKRKKTDICIFPFKHLTNRFTLHILIDE